MVLAEKICNVTVIKDGQDLIAHKNNVKIIAMKMDIVLMDNAIVKMVYLCLLYFQGILDPIAFIKPVLMPVTITEYVSMGDVNAILPM